MSAASSSSSSVAVAHRKPPPDTMAVSFQAKLSGLADNSMFVSLGVVVYGSSDTQTDPAYNHYCELDKSQKACELVYVMDQARRLPYFLHVGLVLTWKEPDSGYVLLTDMAHGWVPMHRVVEAFALSKSVSVPLFGILGQSTPLATLSLTPKDVMSSKSMLDLPSLLPHKDAQRENLLEYDPGGVRMDLISRVLDFYQSQPSKGYTYAAEHDDISVVLSGYKSYYGVIPLVMFPYAATRQVNLPDVQEAWLLHLMHLGGANVGVADVESFGRQKAEVKSDWVGEMCTVYFRGMVYAHDTTFRTGSGTATPCDDWVSLNGYPDTDHNSYDCEDGAQWMTELVIGIRNGTFQSKALRDLQRYLSAYTPCFALVSIFSADRSRYFDRRECYVPHAMMLLVDRKYIMGEAPNARTMPVILGESTVPVQAGCIGDRVQNLWGDDLDEDQTVMMTFYRMRHLFAERGDATAGILYRRACRTKMDLNLATGRALYGMVYSLIAVDLPDGSVRHICLTDSARKTIGVPMNKFLSYDACVERHTVIDIKKGSDVRANLDKMMAEWPRSKMPRPPSELPDYSRLVQPATTGCMWRYLVYGPLFENDKGFHDSLLKMIRFDPERIVKEDIDDESLRTKVLSRASTVRVLDPQKFYITEKSFAYAIDVEVK